VFSAEDREWLRDELVSGARADVRLSAAALLGSSALGREDRWSDIDIALCLACDADRTLAIADWTDRMYSEHAAVHHMDVTRGETLYRVFLLSSTLQVDVSFWPPAHFGAIGPNFRLLFGTAANPLAAAAPSAVELVGMGWLYALHARSSIARGRVWQAEYMISAMRDQVLALACYATGCLRSKAEAWTTFRRRRPWPSRLGSSARSRSQSSSMLSLRSPRRCSLRPNEPIPDSPIA